MFKLCDGIVQEYKVYLKRVKILLWTITIIILIIKIIVSVYAVKDPLYGPLAKMIVDDLVGLSLVYAVLHMK